MSDFFAMDSPSTSLGIQFEYHNYYPSYYAIKIWNEFVKLIKLFFNEYARTQKLRD